MSTNELANALHAGGVLQLSPNANECRLMGSWGILRVAPGEAAGSWIVFLEQPIRFSGGGGVDEVSTVVCQGTPFGGTPGIFFQCTPLHESIPEEVGIRGNIAIQAWTNATPPVPAPGPHYLNLTVFRIPGLGG